MTELKPHLNEIRERYPNLGDDEVFLTWFITAYLTGAEDASVAALAGGARDKGIDAVLVDDRARKVFVIQSKFRTKQKGGSETRQTVMALAQLGRPLATSTTVELNAFLENVSPEVRDKVREARKRLERGYRLHLMFVSPARVSSALEDEAKKVASRGNADFEVVADGRLRLLLRDFIEGAAPPIPTVDLEMEYGSGVSIKGHLHRFDNRTEIESWVFPMRADAIVDLYERGGPRLFARNIRGFLGESTSVNKGMEVTLAKEPEFFFYYNNGVTIVCDRAELVSTKGRDVLRVDGAQVINGQQTTRVLALKAGKSTRATVLVKVIRIPRTDDKLHQFDQMVSRIVASTNWQTAVKPSDLMSNDRRQVEIERELRKLGYAYIRKRQTKGEARATYGRKLKWFVKKEDLAQAIAGCDLDPVVSRSGKDNLFTEANYSSVFPSSDPWYYLPRYWLAQAVTAGARGRPQRGYAKWLVLGFVWAEIQPHIRKQSHNRAFVSLLARRRSEVPPALQQAIELAYRGAIRYYNQNSGSGETKVDISQFFRGKRGRDKEFRDYWAAGPPTGPRRIASKIKAFGDFATGGRR